jgi:ParE toxin of type II toxin-antitoxin system, parDE
MRYYEEVKEEAKVDIAEAMVYYSFKSDGLDLKFFTEFEASVKRILQNPFAFKKIYKSFRQTAMKKFPYVIVYEPVGKSVIIFSVFNTWKHPRKKITRIRK